MRLVYLIGQEQSGFLLDWNECLKIFFFLVFRQAFKKARSLGLGDLDFSAVIEAVKFSKE